MQSKIIPIQLQLALIDIGARYEPLEEYMAINKMLGGPIVDTPMVIPMQEIPQEIPVVQARNDSSGVYINIGRRRVDYIFKVKDQSQFIDFEIVAGQLINRYKDSGFIRFGLIVQYLIPQKSPSQWLKDTFFKPSPQNWDEISFQFNRKSNLHGLSVNHILCFPG